MLSPKCVSNGVLLEERRGTNNKSYEAICVLCVRCLITALSADVSVTLVHLGSGHGPAHGKSRNQCPAKRKYPRIIGYPWIAGL